MLEKDIDHFIEHFGVTHYVSAIELGALRFSVLTEEEYEKKVAASGSASLNSMLYGGVDMSASHSNKKKCQDASFRAKRNWETHNRCREKESR